MIVERNPTGESLRPVGTDAFNLVQLDENAKLPAVDGSNLTNLPAAEGAMAVTKYLAWSIFGGI